MNTTVQFIDKTTGRLITSPPTSEKTAEQAVQSMRRIGFDAWLHVA